MIAAPEEWGVWSMDTARALSKRSVFQTLTQSEAFGYVCPGFAGSQPNVRKGRAASRTDTLQGLRLGMACDPIVQRHTSGRSPFQATLAPERHSPPAHRAAKPQDPALK